MSLLEINGRVVDTATGQPVAAGNDFKKPLHKPATSIDGVMRHHVQPKPIASASRPAGAPKPGNRITQHAAKHRPQKARTLMRQGLRKPQIYQPQNHRLATSAETLNAGLPVKVDISRTVRAKSTPRHKLISRFSASGTPSLFVKKTGHLPMVRHRDVMAEPRAVSVPVPAEEDNGRFGQAISQATSHQANPVALPKGRHKLAKKLGLTKRALSLTSAALAAAALIAFFAYQNVPNIKLRIAASRADVPASLPGYKPSGFSVGQIAGSPGQIVINFSSNTNDSRSFQISQRKSNWNSEALLANYVIANRYTYQIRQEQGKTIYIYQVDDNSNATWVDGGVWYNIESKANLNQDQLNQMALSL